jgi:hypothetical protein
MDGAARFYFSVGEIKKAAFPQPFLRKIAFYGKTQLARRAKATRHRFARMAIAIKAELCVNPLIFKTKILVIIC